MNDLIGFLIVVYVFYGIVAVYIKIDDIKEDRVVKMSDLIFGIIFLPIVIVELVWFILIALIKILYEKINDKVIWRF